MSSSFTARSFSTTAKQYSKKQKAPLRRGFFEIRDKREDRREAVRSARGYYVLCGALVPSGTGESEKVFSNRLLKFFAYFLFGHDNTKTEMKNHLCLLFIKFVQTNYWSFFCLLCKPRLCRYLNICTKSPITKVSFACFLFRRKKQKRRWKIIFVCLL